jgi:uncharacterized protein (TIGR02145 family)
MKYFKIIRHYTLIIAGLLIMLTISSCKHPPLLTTSEAEKITQTSASCGGNISIEYDGPVVERGVYWCTDTNHFTSDQRTKDGTGIGSFKSNISGLNPGTVYYFKAYATNKSGIGFGGIRHFKTLPGVIDIDRNVYDTVVIGSQIWMKQNLRVTHYRNGKLIALAVDTLAWHLDKKGARCNPLNDTTLGKEYGVLYNWYAVNTGELCPKGWHVPTSAEWDTLCKFFGGEKTAGGIMKEKGTSHWKSPNKGATNKYDFTALPGGYRNYLGNFDSIINVCAYWWSSTAKTDNFAWYGNLKFDKEELFIQYFKKNQGFFVRCIKDK